MLKEVDATDDKGARFEMVVKGVFAGNIFDLGAGKVSVLFGLASSLQYELWSEFAAHLRTLMSERNP